MVNDSFALGSTMKFRYVSMHFGLMNIEYLAEISDDTLDEKDNAPFPIVVDNNNHRVTPYIDLIINSIHYIYEEIVAESNRGNTTLIIVYFI